ncbi:MAG: metallophosphoesterase [Bacteroidales bacterium]|nr:metallophosphoesterase [Candidatus Cryptobacteroides faecihippi]
MKTILLILAAFRVAFIGDPQVDSMDEVRYAQQAIREVRDRGDIDLVIVMGDLVNDKPQLQEIMKSSLDSLPCPWVCAPGNHDRDVYHEKGRKRNMVSFRRHMGYVDTTFIFKGVRFITMDDVREGEHGYEGGFREDQKHWLDSVMKATPKRMRTVISCHIPLSEFSAKDSLATIFKGHRRVVAFCGHTHTVKRSTLELSEDVSFEEVIGGTLCGSWWRGVKGEDGLPYALMNCGSPRGFFITDFKNSRKGWYRLDYKCTGRPEYEKMSARIKDSLLIVNVFGGSLDGSVTLRCGGSEYSLTRRAMPALEALDLDRWNKEKGRQYFKEHRSEMIPILRMNSPHVWAFDYREAGLEALDVLEGSISYKDAAMSFTATVAPGDGIDRYDEIDRLCPPRPETSARFKEGSYPPAARPYREAALAAFHYMMNIPDMTNLLETGKPYRLYQHNAYVSKTHAAHIEGMLALSKADPSQKAEAMKFAKASAEYLLSELEPADAPLAYWPPTYGRQPLEYIPETDGPYLKTAMVGNDPEGADKYRGEVMLLYPADVAIAFVDYFNETGDKRFLDAAIGIGETFLRTRRPDGSWPLKMILATGEPVGENTLVPIRATCMFRALAGATGDVRWRTAEDEGFAWLESHPLKDWNWDGQFEDIKPEEPYKNPTKDNAVEVMLYILERFPGDKARLETCRKLLDLSEKRFLVWETPADHPSWPSPSVLEQYSCFTPIDASSAKMIRAFLAMYEATGERINLAKACTLADTITRIQKESGRIATFWDGVATGDGLSIERYDWLNCMAAAANALFMVDEATGQSK